MDQSAPPVRPALSLLTTLLHPGKSFTARMGLLTAGCVLLLGLAATLLDGWRATEELRKAMGASLAELAFQMADKLERGMHERHREIRLMAGWPSIADPQATPEEKRAVLERIKANYPVHAWIGLTDDKGVVIAATGGLLEGRDVSARPWFPAGMKGPYAGDVHEALLLAKHMQSPPDGNLRFVDVAAPVADPSGRIIGVLCSHLTWEWAREVRDTLLHQAEVRETVEILVVNTKGEVILGSPNCFGRDVSEQAAAWSGDNGFLEQAWPSGTSYLTGFARAGGFLDYPGLGWTVAARAPVASALAPAQAVMTRMMAYGAGLTLVLGLAGWAAAWRFSKPLRSMARQADRIRSGEAGAHLDPLPRQDEIGILSRSLASLVDTLDARNAELVQARDRLEDKVRERTAELTRTNALLAAEAQVRGQAEARSRAVAASLAEAQRLARLGSFETPDCGEQQRWSEELFRLLGLDPASDRPGKSVLLARVHPEDRARMETLLGPECGTERQAEVRLVLEDGTERIAQARVAPLEGGTGLRGTLLDVTKDRQAEALRDEIERITQHDLKAPLNAVINLPELLMEAEGLTEEHRDMLVFIQDAGRRMLSRINHSLVLYRIETGAYVLRPQSVDLDATVRAAARELAGLAENLKAHLDLDRDSPGPVAALGDPVLVHSIAGNLLKNALEASPHGGSVRVRTLSNNGRVVLRVENLGTVPPEVRGRFFEKFSTHGKPGGTGLGSYSARLMARAMGGTLSMRTSDETATTELTLTLPTAP